MVWHVLAHIQPLDTSSGTRADVRVASADLREITGLNGETWEPAMRKPPTLLMRLFDGDFSQAVSPGGASLELAMERLAEGISGVDAYYWPGAQVELYVGKVTDSWPWDNIFKGRVAQFRRLSQTLTLTAEVDDEPFEKDVLTATYAGTGDAEGGADLKNKVKPLVIGRARNVEPVLINATDSVYQFSAYGPIEAVSNLFERGADFGAAAADYASYAALVAADVEPGQWATCLAEGLVRLGAPAYGLITGDVLGHEVSGSTPRLTGAVISALATIAGVSSSLIETATLTAMDTAAPYNINLVLTNQTSFLEIAKRLALPCNHQAGISLTGQFFVAEVDFGGSEVITLDAQGRAVPQVLESAEESTQPPYFKTIMGADRSWRVQTYDEIAFYAPLIDRGDYDAATVYREGNIVAHNGLQWLYINTTASAGNEPAEGSAYWAPLSGVLTERYPNGPPASPPIGSLYFDSQNRPYRFEGKALTFEGDAVLFLGDPVLGPGWVLVQDKSLAASIEALQSIDDDGILTIDEKIRIAIPENSRLEAAYQGISTQAAAMGLAITDLTAARAAWIALRDGLSPAWNDTTQSTPITRTDWDSTLETYRTEIEDARAALNSPGAVTVIPPGTQEAGSYPLVLTPSVKRGASDIRTSDDVSYSITTSGMTATVNDTDGSADKGKITVTAGDSGTIQLTVNVSGVDFGPYTIRFTSSAAASFAANTYSFEFPLPNGDIILMQGGTDTVAANTTVSYNFPVAYSVAPVVSVSGNPSDTAREGNAGLVGNASTTGFDANNSTAVTITINWMAVGKK